MNSYLNLVRALGPRLLSSIEEPSMEPWLKARARSLFGTTRVLAVDALTSWLMIRKRGGPLDNLVANAAQQQYARRRGSHNIILKARQLGMTTYVAARFFLCTLLRPGTVTLQVAHTQEAAQQIFKIVRRFFDNLHRDLRTQIGTDRCTVRELSFSDIDSRYLVDTAGNPRVGRGLTIHNLHASEVALWPGEPRETMASLLAAVVPDGMVDVESIPNGTGGYFHSEWMRAKRGEPGAMTPHFFPWWFEPEYRRTPPPEGIIELSPEEQALAERHGLDAEQICFRRRLCATFGELGPQEYAESDATCFLVSGRPVFETALVERRLAHAPEPVATEEKNALLVWYPPQPGRSYIVGADVAEGVDRGDYSAATVIDATSGLQCAELLERWPIWKFAHALNELGRRYNQALIAVERNNHGHAVLHALHHQLQYPRLYRHSDKRHAADSGPAFGWPMNARTKPEAIHNLARMLRDAPEVFSSKRLLEQCRSFSWTRDGGMAARGGAPTSDPSGHDDLVIAMAIALAVRAQSPPLELLTASSGLRSMP